MARKPRKSDDTAAIEAAAEDLTESAGQSPLMSALLGAHRKKFGHEHVLVAGDVRIYGVEPRSLALQYLLDLNVIPLQSLIAFSGPEKSYKTTAMLEIMRIILSASTEAAGQIINTEGKWSPIRAASMLRKQLKQTHYIPAGTNEQWQEAGGVTLSHLKKMREEDDAEKSLDNPFGSIPPVAIGIDSYNGAQTEKIQSEVTDVGHGAKTFQDRAMQNWQWLSTWRPNLIGLPVAIIVTQHLKDAIGGIGPVPSKSTAGGKGVGFMCDLEIRCSRIGEIEKANRSGATLKWKTHHNSLGHDRRELEVELIEGFDNEDKPITYYDWPLALMNLLIKMQSLPAGRGKRIQEVLGGEIQVIAKQGYNLYTCPALGIDEKKAKDDLVTADVLAALLEEYPAPGEENMRTRLQAALHIPKHLALWKAPL